MYPDTEYGFNTTEYEKGEGNARMNTLNTAEYLTEHVGTIYNSYSVILMHNLERVHSFNFILKSVAFDTFAGSSAWE